MKLLHLTGNRSFAPLFATRSAQVAIMNLPPGAESDEMPSNEHSWSEQWLYVLSGTGEVTIGKTRKSLRNYRLREHSLLVIEKRELHRVKNTGRKLLRTINIYVPPAYDSRGKPVK